MPAKCYHSLQHMGMLAMVPSTGQVAHSPQLISALTTDGFCCVQEIKITGATTFVNPFKDEEAAEAKAEEEERIKVRLVHIRARLVRVPSHSW